MREIKFRGKRVDNGEWVYGCLVNNLWDYSELSDYPKGTPVCEIITGVYDGDCWEDIVSEDNCVVTVVPETVGQLMAKIKRENGDVDDIFEGDLIVHGERVLKVFVYNGNTALSGRDNTTAILLSFNDGKKKVGNIFDNPELATN